MKIKKYNEMSNGHYWEFISEGEYEEIMDNMKNEEFTSEELGIISEKFRGEKVLSDFYTRIVNADRPLYKKGSLNINIISSSDPYFMWITKYPDEWYVIWITGEYCGLIPDNDEDCPYVKCDQFEGLVKLVKEISDSWSLFGKNNI